jgi:hypothetical protein
MLRRLWRLGLRKTPVGLWPVWGFSPSHFFAPVKMLRIFPYRAQKNVIYSRNVMCHNFSKKMRRILAAHKKGGVDDLGKLREQF